MIYTIYSDEGRHYVGWRKTLTAAIKRAEKLDTGVVYEESEEGGYREKVWEGAQ